MFRLLWAELKKIALSDKLIIASVMSIVILLGFFSLLYMENSRNTYDYNYGPQSTVYSRVDFVNMVSEDKGDYYQGLADSINRYVEKDSVTVQLEQLQQLLEINNQAAAKSYQFLPKDDKNLVLTFFEDVENIAQVRDMLEFITSAYNFSKTVPQFNYNQFIFHPKINTRGAMPMPEPEPGYNEPINQNVIKIYNMFYSLDLDNYIGLAEEYRAGGNENIVLELQAAANAYSNAAKTFNNTAQLFKKSDVEFQILKTQECKGVQFSKAQAGHIEEYLLGENGAKSNSEYITEQALLWVADKTIVSGQEFNLWYNRINALSTAMTEYIYSQTVINGLNLNDKQTDNYIYDFNRYEHDYKIAFTEHVLGNNMYLSYKGTAEGYKSPSTSMSFFGALMGMIGGGTVDIYNYTTFVMCFLSAVIIVICVAIGGGMIAGEHKRGTIKMLIIRPYKRHQILSAKIIALIITAIAFSIFSVLLTLLMGKILGLSTVSLPVMSVFNAKVIITYSAIAEVFINTFFMICNIIVYSIIAILFSVIIKSRSASVAVAMLLSFVGSIMTLILASFSAIRYFVFANVDLYMYFGSGSLVRNTNFWFSVGINLLYCAVALLLSYISFTRRDLN